MGRERRLSRKILHIVTRNFIVSSCAVASSTNILFFIVITSMIDTTDIIVAVRNIKLYNAD